MSLVIDDFDESEADKTQAQELEKYGVWVRKPVPETVTPPANNVPPSAPNVPPPIPDEPAAPFSDLGDFDFVEDPSIEAEFSEMPDFDTLVDESMFAEPELPLPEDISTHFAADEPFPVEDADFLAEEVAFLETGAPAGEAEPLPESFAQAADPLPESVAAPMEPDEPALDDFETIDPSAFLDADDAAIQEISIPAEDLENPFDESVAELLANGPESDTPAPAATLSAVPVQDYDSVFETVSLDDFGLGETEEIDLDTFLGDGAPVVPESAAAPAAKPAPAAIEEEVSLEEFGLAGLAASESISLDDFIGTVQEEKNDILEDPPLDMSLTFDDTFVEATQAAPEDYVESEGNFESVLEGSTDDDFDDLFDSIPEVSFPGMEPEKDAAPEFSAEALGSISFDEVSEFDDLLGSLNDDTETHEGEQPQSIARDTFTPAVLETHDYDMTVSLEDDDEDEDDEESGVKAAYEAKTTPDTTITAPQAPEPVAGGTGAEEHEGGSMLENLNEEDIALPSGFDDILSQVAEDAEPEVSDVAIDQATLDALLSRSATGATKDKLEDNTVSTYTGRDTVEDEAGSNGPDDAMEKEILEKIMGELSSIKGEIETMKAEIQSIKSTGLAVEPQPAPAPVEAPVVEEMDAEPPAIDGVDEIAGIVDTALDAAVVAEPLEAVPAVEAPVVEESDAGGFFGDTGDDETIALSGDELDNILNCADFTEEDAPEVTIPAIEETIQEDVPVMPPEIEEPADNLMDEFALADDDSEAGAADIALPDEIDLPQLDDDDFSDVEPDFSADDFVVEASDTSFLGEDTETVTPPEAPADLVEAEPVFDAPVVGPAEIEEAEPAAASPFDKTIDEPTAPFVEDDAFPTQEDIFPLPDAVEEEPPVLADDLSTVPEEPAPVADGIPAFDENAPAAPVQPEAASESADEEDDTTPTDLVFDDQWQQLPDDFDDDLTVADTPEDIAAPEAIGEDDVPADEPVQDIAPEVLPPEPAFDEVPEEPLAAAEPVPEAPADTGSTVSFPTELQEDIKSILLYMDQLLENLPEDKIAEFARSEHFEVYRKLFSELGLA